MAQQHPRSPASIQKVVEDFTLQSVRWWLEKTRAKKLVLGIDGRTGPGSYGRRARSRSAGSSPSGCRSAMLEAITCFRGTSAA